MSQIAHAYLVPAESLGKLSRMVKTRDYASFWQALKEVGDEIQPVYAYSGYVVAVLLAFLAENNIDVPLNVSDINLADLSCSDVGLIVAADSSDARECLQVLAAQPAEESTLGRYFEDFTHAPADESGKAMMEALKFVYNGLDAIKDRPGYYLLFAG